MEENINKKRILIIDDNENIRHLLKLYLQREGFEIYQAENGKEGYKKSIELKPDLIIMDIMMPVCNGIEAMHLLQNNPATENIPVIMLTAKGEKSDVVQTVLLGAKDYIVKPFKIPNVIERVKLIITETDKKNPVTNTDDQ